MRTGLGQDADKLSDKKRTPDENRLRDSDGRRSSEGRAADAEPTPALMEVPLSAAPPSVDDVLARFAACARDLRPRVEARRGRPGVGASRWVRALFDPITQMRADGCSWDDVVECLRMARVPLDGGAEWTPGLVGRLYRRVRAARAADPKKKPVAVAAGANRTPAVAPPSPSPAVRDEAPAPRRTGGFALPNETPAAPGYGDLIPSGERLPEWWDMFAERNAWGNLPRNGRLRGPPAGRDPEEFRC